VLDSAAHPRLSPDVPAGGLSFPFHFVSGHSVRHQLVLMTFDYSLIDQKDTTVSLGVRISRVSFRGVWGVSDPPFWVLLFFCCRIVDV
jgi:hypothetical protein